MKTTPIEAKTISADYDRSALMRKLANFRIM